MNTQMLEILRNFGTINSNLVFREGNVVRTVSDAKNVMAKATSPEPMPKEFGIYDINELMSALNLIEGASVSYEDKHLLIQGENSSIKYFYSDVEMLTSAPDKDIMMPPCEVNFTLTEPVLSGLRKASQAFGHKTVLIENGGEGKVKLSIVDLKNPSSNAYSVSVSGNFGSVQDTTRLSINIDNLKLVSGDYQVEVSSKLISKFTNTSKSFEYWIALEKN